MAGHSKWANIKHRKGAQDAKRSKLFSKVVKDIMVASRVGGPDPDANPRLRLAVAKAKAVSLPRDNLDRAILKGAGLLDGQMFEEVMYEAYGPGGVALLIDVLTDNRGRTGPEIKHLLSKRGIPLAASGAAAHSFQRVGRLLVAKASIDEDALTMAGLEHGADDVFEDVDDNGDEVWQVVCEIADLETLREGLEAEGVELDGYGLWWLPTITVPVDGKDAEKLFALIDLLEENDDVQAVHANFEVSDEEMERIASS